MSEKKVPIKIKSPEIKKIIMFLEEKYTSNFPLDGRTKFGGAFAKTAIILGLGHDKTTAQISSSVTKYAAGHTTPTTLYAKILANVFKEIDPSRKWNERWFMGTYIEFKQGYSENRPDNPYLVDIGVTYKDINKKYDGRNPMKQFLGRWILYRHNALYQGENERTMLRELLYIWRDEQGIYKFKQYNNRDKNSVEAKVVAFNGTVIRSGGTVGFIGKGEATDRLRFMALKLETGHHEQHYCKYGRLLSFQYETPSPFHAGFILLRDSISPLKKKPHDIIEADNNQRAMEVVNQYFPASPRDPQKKISISDQFESQKNIMEVDFQDEETLAWLLEWLDNTPETHSKVDVKNPTDFDTKWEVKGVRRNWNLVTNSDLYKNSPD